MGLLSTLAAHDLGYLSTDDAGRAARSTLTTLEGLERYQGHFLNWYDTATLAPLHPRYVSTVDSGNLAGALIALAQGLLALDDSAADARAAARRDWPTPPTCSRAASSSSPARRATARRR